MRCFYGFFVTNFPNALLFPHIHRITSGGQMHFWLHNLNVCFTMRSSKEWNEIIATTHCSKSAFLILSKSSVKTPSSLLTSIRIAWKSKVEGWMLFFPPTFSAIFDSTFALTIGALERASQISCAIFLYSWISPYSRKMNSNSSLG